MDRIYRRPNKTDDSEFMSRASNRRWMKLGPAVLVAALALNGCGTSPGNAPDEANAPSDAATEDGGAHGAAAGTGEQPDAAASAEIEKEPADNSAGGSNDSESTPADDSKEGDQPDSNAADPEGVVDQVRAQLKLADAELPTKFELAEGKYLTASIEKNEENAFNVVFYETEEPVPVDDDSLNPDESTPILAIYNAETYDDPTSVKDIFFDAGDLDNIPQEMAVDLGHDIVGMQEGAAGTQYLSWKEGRWVLQVKSLSLDEMDQPGIAKKMVDYLEGHSLPAPDDAGRVRAEYAEGGDRVRNLVAWNKGDVVYQIDTDHVPLEALAMAVSVK
ncbi:hypothetical protein QWJ34_18835 [Saccharibacillus sp. CPCC 101409]|uniref:hypothetical protein n=1 Tax=Saccharibacillus sp. CPCC 101409 TaxID=3058041 RepID=UPI00267154FD|nr:hypothetical protein [Saccharibacillus sp. CPCC 101409]MDO3411825.1 hypothetical protein [Saccharibacillus sp. CPCC 101409]